MRIKSKKIMTICAIATLMVFMFTAVAFAAPLQFVYYQNNDGQMVKADVELASATGSTMMNALKTQYSTARNAFLQVFFEDNAGNVFDWMTNGVMGGKSWNEVQQGATTTAPTATKELKTDGTVGDPGTPLGVSSITATNGTITVKMTGDGTPTAGDFSFVYRIGDAADKPNLTVKDFAWDAVTKTVTFAFEPFAATSQEQSIKIGWNYVGNEKGGWADPFSVAANALDVSSVSAITATNGTIEVTLSSAPTTPPAAADFTFTQKIGTADATALVAGGFSWNPATKVASFTFSPIAEAAAAQNVVVSVSYKTAAAVAAPVFTIPAKSAPQLRIGEAAALAADSAAGKLSANGAYVMHLTAEVYDQTGALKTDFVGQAEFVSKQNLVAAQQIAAFDQGKAVFNVTLPNSKEDIQDEVYIVIKQHADVDYRGLKTDLLNLTYKAYNPGDGGGEQNLVYTIDSVRSADLADRVNVYISGIPADKLTAVQDAIKAQLKLYNDINCANPIDVIAVEDAKQITIGQNNYVFTAILEDVAYKAAGYTMAELQAVALNDNEYNYWTVEAAVGNPSISLKQAPKDTVNQKFMLIDKTIPRLEKVEAPRKLANGENDDAWLEVNTLVAYFSEAVNRITAEQTSNWVLNGHMLVDADVYSIRVLDLKVCEDQTGKDLLAKKAIADYVTKESMGRNVVVIQLKNAAAESYLKNGQNLLQARSIADIAGLTDLSDNNKITTQDFIFPYEKPAVSPSVAIVKESPEQYVITVKGFYADKDATIPYAVATPAVKTELLDDPVRNLVKDTTNNTRIVALPASEPNKHIVELTSDWTKLLAEPTTYHNKFFRVTLTGTAYNRYGVAIAADDIARWAEVQVPEDTVSPAIAVKDDNTKNIVYVGATVTANDIPAYTTTYGHMIITMDEPVQLYNDAGVNFIAPARTPSTLQENQAGVPMPSFEYVKVATSVANPLVSVGTKYDGELVTVSSMNEHDCIFGVQPKYNTAGANPLDEGQWKLVVRAISDDVGNTMRTEEVPFKLSVPTQSTKVNPYVVWAFADDDKYVDANNNAKWDAGEVINDYVYILYSREMGVDVLRSATYDVNGKQLGQDADITSKSYVAYQDRSQTGTEYFGLANTKTGVINQPEQWKPQLVTIQLPADFIIGGDDLDGDRDGKFTKNVLTLPLTLTAVNDNDAATVETLLFTNNVIKGSNQFELTFDKNYGVTGIADAGTVIGMPAFSYAPNAFINTANSYFNYLKPVVASDKTALAAAITTANAKVEADYTAASWAAFKTARDAAIVVNNDAAATQAQIDAALANLNTASAGLVPVVAVDKTNLNAAITTADTKVQADYTAATWTTFAAALTAAKTVSADASATQAQVDTALADLNTASAGLVAVGADVDEIVATTKAATFGSSVNVTLTVNGTPDYTGATKYQIWKGGTAVTAIKTLGTSGTAFPALNVGDAVTVKLFNDAGTEVGSKDLNLVAGV